MSENNRPLFQLSEKVGVIIDVLSEKHGEPIPTRKAFAARYGIAESTLSSACSRKSISADLQRQLSAIGEFSIDVIEWYDDVATSKGIEYPMYRRDSASDFRRMLMAVHNLRQKDERCIVSFAPRLLERRIASFAVDGGGQRIPADESVQLFFTLIMAPAYLGQHLAFAFNSVALRLSLLAESPAAFSHPPAFEATAASEREEIRSLNGITIKPKGTVHNPEWEIIADTAPSIIDGEFVTRDAPLCSISGLQLGETIHVELAVNPRYGSLTDLSGAPLPDIHKQKVLKMLLKKRLNNGDISGWITLGTQTLQYNRSGAKDDRNL